MLWGPLASARATTRPSGCCTRGRVPAHHRRACEARRDRRRGRSPRAGRAASRGTFAELGAMTGYDVGGESTPAREAGFQRWGLHARVPVDAIRERSRAHRPSRDIRLRARARLEIIGLDGMRMFSYGGACLASTPRSGEPWKRAPTTWGRRSVLASVKHQPPGTPSTWLPLSCSGFSRPTWQGGHAPPG